MGDLNALSGRVIPVSTKSKRARASRGTCRNGALARKAPGV